MVKPTVEYSELQTTLDPETIGKSVVLFPHTHTSPFVSNTMLVLTSRVVSFDPLTGEIETENTRYIPQPIGETK